MKIEYLDSLEYRPGYVVDGWLKYEHDLTWHGDIYDYDFQCYAVDELHACPLSLEDKAMMIVNKLIDSDERNIEEIPDADE